MPCPRLVVGGVIIDRSGNEPRVLAARRTGPPLLAGHWEFPGGKVEKDETPQVALARELREELNIRVVVLSEIAPAEGTTWPISAVFTMRLYVCEIESGHLSSGAAHDHVMWLSADQLDDVEWLDSDTQALGQVALLLRR